jgi:hypothetical protein
VTTRLVTGRPKAAAEAQAARTRAVLAGATAVLDEVDAAVDPRTPEAALADLDRVLGPDPAAGRRLTEEDLPLQGFFYDLGDEVPATFFGEDGATYRAALRESYDDCYSRETVEEARYVEAMRRAHLDGMPDYEEFYGPRPEPVLVRRDTGRFTVDVERSQAAYDEFIALMDGLRRTFEAVGPAVDRVNAQLRVAGSVLGPAIIDEVRRSARRQRRWRRRAVRRQRAWANQQVERTRRRRLVAERRQRDEVEVMMRHRVAMGDILRYGRAEAYSTWWVER